MRNLLNRQDGQGLVEYYAVILLLTFVVVAVIFGLLAQDSTDGDAGQTFGDGRVRCFLCRGYAVHLGIVLLPEGVCGSHV